MADHAALLVTVVARQRLALGVGSEVSYFTGTHSFVPGSVLRGALAAAWIADPKHGPPSMRDGRADEFRELFDGDIRYGPLHVTGSSVIPVSVWRCKYPKDDECRRVAVDRAFEDGDACPACHGGSLEQGKGQVELPPGVGLERVTRTSINRTTGTAEDGELYAHAALPAGTTLTGYIHGRDSWLQSRGSWLEQPRTLRLGGRRTVGGAASYSAVPVTRPALPEPLLAGGMLTIRLASPAILTDAAGRPRLDPDPELDLAHAQTGAVTERAWARPVTWEGWHAASRLPKPDELCATAGSTYRIAGPDEGLRRLARRLLRDGIGLRRAEGFGEVQVITGPWRPSPVRAVITRQASADERVRDWHGKVARLSLNPAQERWLVGALRDLQLGHQRAAGDRVQAVRLAAAEMLARPGADAFSGRQRDQLRELLAEPDAQVLRDLTTLLLAGLPAVASGHAEPGTDEPGTDEPDPAQAGQAGTGAG